MNSTDQQPSNPTATQGQAPVAAPGYFMSPPPQAVPVASPPQAPQQVSPPALQSATDTTTLSDLDKEWVDRARVIIGQTKGDPHLQSRELAKVRAEYLKTRFDKHIKLTEDQSK